MKALAEVLSYMAIIMAGLVWYIYFAYPSVEEVLLG